MRLRVLTSCASRQAATERLDDEKLATLRRWGEGLCSDARDEVRAAGRAIVLLVEEVERLHVDLWHGGQAGAEAASAEGPEEARSLAGTLRERVRARARRSPSSS